MATTTQKKTTKKVQPEVKPVAQATDNKTVELLQAEVEQLRSMISMMMNGNFNAKKNDADRDVLFISLCHHTLNLSTEPYGGGSVYTFTEYGEEQPIPYTDARAIIRNNKKFVREGKCYIADAEIIEAEHLNKAYEKLLNQDEMLELLNKDRQAFSKIFNNMTVVQKNLFKEIVMNKIAQDKNSVDMNIVQMVNEDLGTDILKEVEFSKGVFSTLE